jgi:predicted dithiol-disulfide oxidoreductase (DUF899 family)
VAPSSVLRIACDCSTPRFQTRYVRDDGHGMTPTIHVHVRDPTRVAPVRARRAPSSSEDGDVYHTHSAYARGLDALWGMYQWLDRAPRGRNETGGVWFRRHDEYNEG